MNNDDFKEVPDNIQDNNGETTNNIDNTNDNKSNDYEDVCYICRRPESVAENTKLSCMTVPHS